MLGDFVMSRSDEMPDRQRPSEARTILASDPRILRATCCEDDLSMSSCPGQTSQDFRRVLSRRYSSQRKHQSIQCARMIPLSPGTPVTWKHGSDCSWLAGSEVPKLFKPYGKESEM